MLFVVAFTAVKDISNLHNQEVGTAICSITVPDSSALDDEYFQTYLFSGIFILSMFRVSDGEIFATEWAMQPRFH